MIVSKRKDGDMILQENIARFCKKNGIKYQNIVTSHQVHGKEVKIVQENGEKLIADGLLTKSTNVVLGVRVADCLPVSMKTENICGLLHVGWRGMIEGIIEEGIKKMTEEGKVKAEDIIFEIGPGIGSCHFEIGEDLVKRFSEDKVIKDPAPYLIEKKERVFLDLKKIVRDKIISQGGRVIKISSICTFCSDDHFSFRRNNKSERLIALVSL